MEQDDPETARLVILKFFGGLTNKEVAKSLGVTERTMERQWTYAKACFISHEARGFLRTAVIYVSVFEAPKREHSPAFKSV